MLADITAQLQESAPHITAAERSLLEAELAVLKGEICCWSAQGEAAVTYALEALGKAPRTQTFLRGSAYLYYCFGMQ